MKNLPILFQSLLLVGAVTLMPNGSAAAAPSLSTPDSWQSVETVLPVDDTAALLQSPDSAALIQLGSGRLDVLSPKQQVLDVHVLSHPTKLVLLTASESGQLQKQVYDAQGKAMSHTPFQVKLPKNGEARWVAPTLKASERVMIQSDNQFTLYDAKGHSILRYDAAARSDGNYEHIRVDDWDFSAYPYLAIEYEGQRTMASDFFIQVVNLYDKSVKPLPGLAIDKQVKIDAQNRLQAWSSFLYEGIGPANAISPDLAEKQSFHAAYSLSSGKPLVDHKQLFEQPKGMEPSGWETQIAGSYVFVRDPKAGSWSLYPATASAPITSAHTGLEADAKFIGYYPASKIAYFLVKTSSGTQTSEVRKIQL